MIDKINQQILVKLGKSYGRDLRGQNKRYICWQFCREVYSLLGMKLTCPHRNLKRIMQPEVPCIVLFHAVISWHSGVVWPDGLHFIHACPKNSSDLNPTEYVIRKSRLTGWPYKMIIEGYYVPR